MPKTATKRPLSDAEKAKKRKEALALLDYPSRALAQGKALYGVGKGIINDGLASLIAGAEYAGDRSVTKDVPKDINRLGKMVAQNAGSYADAGNSLYRLIANDGKQAVPDYYRNKASNAYQEQFNPSPADPRLERFGNFYADPLAVGFGTGRAARGLADPKLYRQIAEDMAKGARSNAIENLWHGSPHTFDRFDLDKIGTGEGAQAYGHGAYLAESPDVAHGYQYSTQTPEILIKGDSWKGDQSGVYRNPDGMHEGYLDDVSYSAIRALAGSRPDKSLVEIAGDAERFLLRRGEPQANIDSVKKAILSGDISLVKNDGNIYQTRLAWPDAREATDPLSPDHFLHWDKPLSEQADIVKGISPQSLGLTYKQLENGNHAFVNSEGKIIGNLQKGGTQESFAKNWAENVLRGSGSDLYRQLGQGMEGGPRVSSALLEAGIPGIRYLDGGSRGAGAGSHNYVVFDDKLIDIVSRNGQKP